MKKITIVLNVPFLDRIPSLCTLIDYLGQRGHRVVIITAKADDENIKQFKSENISYKFVKKRARRVELPTSIKILTSLLRDIIFDRSDIYIGGDYIANRIISIFKPLFRFRYIDFVLEYPSIDVKEEIEVLRYADYLITHDRWHADFLHQLSGISKDRMYCLPNATSSKQMYNTSTLLRDRLNINDKRDIILHSGGLHPGFLCKELALSTSSWGEGSVLVFHTSSNVEKTEYFQEIKSISSNKIFFSTTPVSSSELDSLVASAHIGVALYTLKNRDYKALYMGLAAGKIGNYLKCGLPVIATRLPSFSYIEEFKCGVLIDDMEQIAAAIDTINRDYDTFRVNAHLCYESLWCPDRYLMDIESDIIGNL